MKAIIKVTDYLSFEVEAEQEDELFKQIARTQEIFQQQDCGKCHSKDVKFVSRMDSSSNEWLEVTCQSCRAKLVFGRTKKGGLVFPKIRWGQLSEKQQEQRGDEKAYADSHRDYLPNRGWFIFRPNTNN